MSKQNIFFWLCGFCCGVVALIGGYAALFHGEFAGTKPSVGPPGPNCAAQLDTIRGQIDLYRSQQGRFPWAPGEVDETQWRPLIGQYLLAAPRNPYCPNRRKISTRIIELTERGATGAGMDPGEAGWVWNSTDNELYATGLENDPYY